jgi:hypothetical protein
MILQRRDDESVEELVYRYSDEMHINVCKKICNALEKDIEKVVLATIEPDGLDIYCTKENYLDTLLTNLPAVEEMEEYELCKEVHDWVSKLKYDQWKK